jgi:NAD(P)H dehydrogenase (quinone)
MFAITGITGKVGGAVAQHLISQGHKVRAIVRSEEKGRQWAALGCDVAIAAVEDPIALAKAFDNTDGVFLMIPPNFDPEPGFPQTRENAAAIRHAIETAQPKKIVFLSTVGAHVAEPNLLNNSMLTEQMLQSLSIPVAMLRPGWFMENASWDMASARAGMIPSFLQPLDHAIPMVATADIAQVAAEILNETWSGIRIVELEGPQRYSANDIAVGFGLALGRSVQTEPVPRETWESLFRSQGMKNPMPRMRMIDGFNEGWIDFEFGASESRKGTTRLESVLESLAREAGERK